MQDLTTRRATHVDELPEVGIHFGAGGATTPEELEQEGTRDVGYAIDLARRCLDAGAYMIMIESEGITEEVTTWRTDVVATITRELGLEKVMFEAADPEVFTVEVRDNGVGIGQNQHVTDLAPGAAIGF